MEEAEDGALLVYGPATDETLDSDGQIIDLAYSKSAIPEWLATGGNIRVMHSQHLYPAGVGVEVDTQDNAVWVKAAIYEPTAKLLCRTKVLKAFSVGIGEPVGIVKDVRAKFGRIVSGPIVEISLVDRPANPSCAYQIVKRAKDGSPELVSAFTEGADMAAKSADPAAVKELDLTSPPLPETKDIDPAAAKVDGADTAKSADAEPAAEKAPEPVAEKSPEAVEAKADDGEKKPPATEDDKDEDTKPGPKDETPPAVEEDADEDTKPGAKKSLDPSWVIKRAHAATCAAYASDVIKASYPTIEKDGIAATVGGATLAGIFAMLQQEMAEDGGTGSEAWDIQSLAEAYAELSSFARSEMWEAMDEAMEDGPLFFAAHEELHKLFKAINSVGSDAAALPNLDPTDPPDAGSFKRPSYVGDGNAVLQTDNRQDVPDPSEFRRGALTAGQQRHLGASKDANSSGTPGRVFYTREQRANAAEAMEGIHDHIAAVFPELCPMSQTAFIPPEEVLPPDGGDTAGAIKDASAPPQGEMPGEKAAAATPAATKAATGVDVDVLTAQITAAVTASMEKAYGGQLADLKQKYEALASEPDPAQAPTRVAGLGTLRVVEKVAHKTPAEVQQDAVVDEQRTYFEQVVRDSSDPQLRELALAKLRQMPAKTG